MRQNRDFWKQIGWNASLIFLLAFIVYWPALHGGFIWDDTVMITENPLIHRDDGLKFIWFSTAQLDYFPLTLTTLWLEWRCWGDNPLGYHVVNISLHAISALLLWRVLARLRIPGGYVAALIFLVHPVCVSSAAWISELRNTLSLVLFLLSALFYFRFLDERTSQGKSGQEGKIRPGSFKSYFASLFSFLLALLAKTSVVTLPIILLMGYVWRQRNQNEKLSQRDCLRLLPFILFSLALGLSTVWFQRRAIGGYTNDPFCARIVGGGWALWFYLGKILVPINLTLLYPRWEINLSSPLAYMPWMFWLGLLCVCWKFREKWGWAALFGLGYFFVTLLPVLGIFDMSFLMYSRVADHLQYLSLPGVVALATGSIAFWLKNTHSSAKEVWHPTYAATVAILVLAAMSWSHTHPFADAETLWRDNISKNPTAAAAWNNLGMALEVKGNFEEAESCYRTSLRIKSPNSNADQQLASLLIRQGHVDEAMEHFQSALKTSAEPVKVYNSLGNAYTRLNQLDEAIASFRSALHLNPNYDIAWYNLGLALARQQKTDEAIDCFLKVLAVRPYSADTHNNIASLLINKGDFEGGAAHLFKAVELQPDHAESHFNLSVALAKLGRMEESRQHYERAVQLRPDLRRN